jgi:hypothetical protein
VKIAVTRRGCSRRDEYASEAQAMSSDIRRRVSKGDAVSNTIPNLFSGLVERDNIVGLGLVIAAMMRVFFAVLEQVAMQLLDVVFGERDLPQDWKSSSIVSA